MAQMMKMMNMTRNQLNQSKTKMICPRRNYPRRKIMRKMKISNNKDKKFESPAAEMKK